MRLGETRGSENDTSRKSSPQHDAAESLPRCERCWRKPAYRTPTVSRRTDHQTCDVFKRSLTNRNKTNSRTEPNKRELFKPFSPQASWWGRAWSSFGRTRSPPFSCHPKPCHPGASRRGLFSRALASCWGRFPPLAVGGVPMIRYKDRERLSGARGEGFSMT